MVSIPPAYTQGNHSPRDPCNTGTQGTFSRRPPQLSPYSDGSTYSALLAPPYHARRDSIIHATTRTIASADPTVPQAPYAHPLHVPRRTVTHHQSYTTPRPLHGKRSVPQHTRPPSHAFRLHQLHQSTQNDIAPLMCYDGLHRVIQCQIFLRCRPRGQHRPRTHNRRYHSRSHVRLPLQQLHSWSEHPPSIATLLDVRPQYLAASCRHRVETIGLAPSQYPVNENQQARSMMSSVTEVHVAKCAQW